MGGREHHGFGFGRGPGKRGFLDGGMPGGRKISAADLQLVLLALLEQNPAHGYELIRALEERSNGFYTPSPGVIYPALTYLGEAGHADVTQDGNRKLYTLTKIGRKILDGDRVRAQSILDALGRVGGRMEQVREAFAGLDELDPNAADDLFRSRSALKMALMRARDCSPRDASRIAKILDRATAEILRIL